jgi:hypothetical protein
MGLFEGATWLRASNNHGYGPTPIPQPQDLKISELIRGWMTLDDRARAEAAEAIEEEQRATLLAFSERMASLAVRRQDSTLIVLGVVALGVDGWRYDWRDNVLVLSLHYDAARRCGRSPEVLFDEAARLLPRKPKEALGQFLRRSNEDKSIEAMGYRAAADADGFRYLRNW